MPINLKHKESGIGLFFAAAQWFAFVKIWLRFTEFIWPVLIKLQTDYAISDMNFIIIFGVLTNAITFIVGDLLFGLIYSAQIPFFEKYKALDEPWPW